MSAIFGIANMNGDSITKDVENKMIDALKIYKLDSIKSVYRNNIFLGCGIQYITPESLHEILPFYDEREGLIITADAIIDNREELFNLLNVSIDENNVVTDSQLVLLAYKKWGQESPKYLVGDFAFVIWDEKKKELFCARDHVGTRTFYYYNYNNLFIFSTLIKPIYNALNITPEFNEKWTTDFLALPLTLHQCECNETIFEGIYELPPAHTLVISEKGVVKNQYWNPLKEVKPLKLKNDEAYEEEFRRVFAEAVKCRLRSVSEIGIMLSGGMDSGSVACVAAKLLGEDNKRLKAFSSVPMKGFKNNLPNYIIPNESEYIESIRHSYNNIDINYCESEGKDSLTDIKYIMNVLEQPHKIIENMFWYNNILEIAARDKCKVILNGQFGNFTVSYGDFLIHMRTLFKKCKILKIKNEIEGFSKLNDISEKNIRKLVYHAIAPYNLRKFINLKIRGKTNKFDMNLLNKDLAQKWNIKNRFTERGYYNEVCKYYDIKQSKKLMVDSVLLCQMASIETKLSLSHGMVERDPTRDKRVIEFCLSLPNDQYVRNGEERYIIRRAMEGTLPDKIRLNTNTRGLQSADWIQRLQLVSKDVFSKLNLMIDDSNINKYLDMDMLKTDLVSLGDSFDEKNTPVIRRLLVSLIFSLFMQVYNK